MARSGAHFLPDGGYSVSELRRLGFTKHDPEKSPHGMLTKDPFTLSIDSYKIDLLGRRRASPDTPDYDTRMFVDGTMAATLSGDTRFRVKDGKLTLEGARIRFYDTDFDLVSKAHTNTAGGELLGTVYDPEAKDRRFDIEFRDTNDPSDPRQQRSDRPNAKVWGTVDQDAYAAMREETKRNEKQEICVHGRP